MCIRDRYQHDMNQKKLGEALGGVVEDCVNKVGVDLNTACLLYTSFTDNIKPREPKLAGICS